MFNMINNSLCITLIYQQGRKHPLDTPKRMTERREREGEREKERQKERERGEGIERERGEMDRERGERDREGE